MSPCLTRHTKEWSAINAPASAVKYTETGCPIRLQNSSQIDRNPRDIATKCGSTKSINAAELEVLDHLFTQGELLRTVGTHHFRQAKLKPAWRLSMTCVPTSDGFWSNGKESRNMHPRQAVLLAPLNKKASKA